jgi:hypothetical protein
MVFLLATTLFAALRTPAGFTFRASTHAEGTASGAISFADMDVAGRVSGEKARIDIEKSRNPRLPKGDVLVTLDGGKTFRLLDPSARTSSPWAPPERSAAKAAPAVVQVRFENPEVKQTGEGPGGTISGWPTKHYTFRITYVSAVDVMGSVQKTAMTRTEELWTAQTLSDRGFAAWLRKDSAPTGNAVFDGRIEADLSSAPGVPLKRVTTSTWKDAEGKDQMVKTTLVVTELRKAASPEALFHAPPDYRVPPEKP